MRHDETKSDAFAKSEQWAQGAGLMRLFEPNRSQEKSKAIRSNSLSGGERNRLLLQRSKNFEDVSLVSGVDFQQDGRGFVLADFDKDGWIDMGLVSTNAPKFRILRNNFAKHFATNQSVTIWLQGGNQNATPNNELSSRQPFGARVIATSSRWTREFQLSCGEGLSSQNSNSIHIGMATEPEIDLVVYWPGGRQTTHDSIKAGSRILIREDGASENIE